MLKLAAENDNLKAQEMEDRKRIAHLLALTEPITQEVRAPVRVVFRWRGDAARTHP